MGKITKTPAEQMAEIRLGASEILSEDDLFEKLKDSYHKQKPLVVKFGADPSRPDLHLGHTVVINKLKQLQDLGHEVVFIIGDFTARIGDPTGKSKTRPELTAAEVEEYAQSYQQQIFKILDPHKTRVVYNSAWLDKLTPVDIVKLLAKRTVQQLMARDDFSTRYKENSPIFLHEFIYPIMQGYDSVELKSDIELGGEDQRFNLLLGREMQKGVGQRSQSLILMPLLEGTDGVKKMSKSLDNYIGVAEDPKDIFGKTMSITDDHMHRFYELLSFKGAEAIARIKAQVQNGTLHPMLAKKDLAEELAARFWGEEQGKKARAEFEQFFSRKEIPDETPLFELDLPDDGRVSLVQLAVNMGFSESKSDVRRAMKQNGLKLDGMPVTEDYQVMELHREYVLKYGKIKVCKVLFR